MLRDETKGIAILMNILIQNQLDDNKISNIYNSAIDILCEVGIECDHKMTVDILKERGRITYNNKRIFFDRNTLEEFFEKKIKGNAKLDIQKETVFQMGGSWQALEYCDPVENIPRFATPEEVVQMTKLSEVLGGRHCTIPVMQGKLNPSLNSLNSERIALIHTKTMGGSSTVIDREEINIISQMHMAAGRKFTLSLSGLISPLKLNPEVLTAYFDQRDNKNLNVNMMGVISMAGATAPLVFPANLSLMLAEAIGLNFVVHTISDGELGIFNFRLDPFDFKSGNVVYGSPNWCIYMKIASELSVGLTGRRGVWGSFRSNAKSVDAQSMMERTASALWQALLGTRYFSAVGQICVDAVFSPVQAVLDREILKYLKSLFADVINIGWFDDIDIVALVKEGVDGNSFLDNQTTIDYFRKMYDFDVLSSYSNLGTWKKDGGKTMNSLAWEDAQALIKSHDFELDETKRRDVESLFEVGVKYIKNR